MSYLVLARKYRPQTFSEVVGQEHVTRTLANAFAQDRVHHAFLFCGPRGVGKTTAARILGKALNCVDGPTAEPCGTCEACVSIANGSAVDYYEMDGASNRGIDAIRELNDAVRYQPAALRKKVYVIDEVHMLTTEAFNALLKTLEEPPPHVTFVMATTEPHKLPNTILSRCQRYDFKLVPASRLAEHLQTIFGREELSVSPAATNLIVRESGGSVRDALSLSDQVISYVGEQQIDEQQVAEVLGVADRALTRALVEALARGDAKTALESVEAAVARSVDEVQLARAVVRYIRDLAVLQAAPDASEQLVAGSEQERADLVGLAKEISRPRVAQMFERMIRACDELGQTQMPRLVLDLALIDVATLEPLVPLGDLLERLETLEGRLGPRGRGGPGGGNRSPRVGGPSSSRSAPAGARRSAAPASPENASPAAQVIPSATPSLAPAVAAPAAPPAPVPAAGSGPVSDFDAVAPSSAAPSSAAPSSAAPSSAVADLGWGPAPASGAAADSALDSSAEAAVGVGAVSVSASPPDVAADDPAALARMWRPPDERPAERRPNGQARNGQARNGQARNGHSETDGRAAPTVASAGIDTAPAAMSAVAAGGAPSDPMAAWGELLADLEKQNRIALVGVYEHARLLEWTAEGVVVGFREGSLQANLATDRQNVQTLKAELASRYGRPLRFVVRVYKDTGGDAPGERRSIVELTQERNQQERESRLAEAREHPLTLHALATFGAEIKEIKIDG